MPARKIPEVTVRDFINLQAASGTQLATLTLQEDFNKCTVSVKISSLCPTHSKFRKCFLNSCRHHVQWIQEGRAEEVFADKCRNNLNTYSRLVLT